MKISTQVTVRERSLVLTYRFIFGYTIGSASWFLIETKAMNTYILVVVREGASYKQERTRSCGTMFFCMRTSNTTRSVYLWKCTVGWGRGGMM